MELKDKLSSRTGSALLLHVSLAANIVRRPVLCFEVEAQSGVRVRVTLV